MGYKALSAADDDKHESSAAVKADEFFLETPLSSLNVSPDHVCDCEMDFHAEECHLLNFTLFQTKNVDAAATEVPEIHLNAASNDAGNRNMALEDTVNTEAFVSPKNDMFTSSPNGDYHLQNLPNVERDANIIHVKYIDICRSVIWLPRFRSFDSVFLSEFESSQAFR